jgi:hypothetical protein
LKYKFLDAVLDYPLVLERLFQQAGVFSEVEIQTAAWIVLQTAGKPRDSILSIELNTT